MENNSSQHLNLEPSVSKKKFTMPHIYVILFLFSAVAAIATYFVPAGVYERVPGPEGRTTIDPDSYKAVEQTPVGLVDFITAIPNGLISAGEVVFFTLIIGGMFMVLRETGIIEIGVDKLTRKFSTKSITVIPVLMIVFALICSLIGTQELSLVYVPVILPLLIALGFDSMVAAAIALVATTAGFTTGFLNPINTGLGQKLSGVPLYSGLEFRIIAFVLIVGAGIFYVIRYAKKVKKNPENSYVYEEDYAKRELYSNNEATEKRIATTRQKIASAALFILFAILVYGVLVQGWFMVEMAGIFIVIGIVVGLLSGLKPIEICEGFNKGFRKVLVGALIVGVARAVAVVMEKGQIMDTIIHNLGPVVGELPSILSAIGMFFVQMLFSFLVPSGSGQALVTMPIMAPLSDLIGVTRQTAVLAYQLGDGLGNILFPTSGYFMATLVIAGVSWQKWVKFYLPLFLIWSGIAIVLLIIAQAIQWTG
ncbi:MULTISPECIES: YfcC family protein [Bacillus]|uniref:C4-dicarboxylate ABC transporter n=2 Tax=Bacillus TaxID=1386 RepID=A0A0M4FRQ5_9BACI|nr:MULTISPECIES: TIGR00366 family protein [Bacillus]ALC80480.1 C4-dicarboxylate ABC transporter [Bacillus gobiensis]MBP1083545.1 putative ion transporter superfamily protein YfcC [Bacillus capparidis]MED1094740.1 TIGR00366 family protein [Bacillus capparidis]